MIRVVYRWQVAPRDFEEFRDVWRATTDHIHATVDGALGSFMLRSFEHESEVITVAKWDSLEAWKRFWGNNSPKEMESMTALGRRISVEVFEEVEDRSR